MTGFLDAPPAPAAIVITEDGGVQLDKFAYAAAQYRKEHRRVVIDGSCRSACCLALSVQDVCVTPRAAVKFHYAYEFGTYRPRYDIINQMLSVIPTSIRIAVDGHLQRNYSAQATLYYSELKSLGIRDCASRGATPNFRAQTPPLTDERLAMLAVPMLRQQEPAATADVVKKPALTLRRIDSATAVPIAPSTLLYRAVVRVASLPARLVHSIWR